MDKTHSSGLAICLLRMTQVETVCGLKKSAIYQKIKEGSFPQPVALSTTHRAWRSDHIADWIASRPLVKLANSPEEVAK